MGLSKGWAVRAIAVSVMSLFSASAHAAPSEFEGLVQFSVVDGRLSYIQENTFQRQTYHAAGALVTIDGWVWDPEEEIHVYIVEPGESWSWIWRDLDTNQIISHYEVTFLGGEDLCWSDGRCGGFTTWWVAIPMQCMPENQRVRVSTYHNAGFMGADYYKPTLFPMGEPSLDLSRTEIHPHIPSFSQGPALSRNPEIDPEDTLLRVDVFDDIETLQGTNCGVPIENALVDVKATIVPESGGHLHFHKPNEAGTGDFLKSPGNEHPEEIKDTREDSGGDETPELSVTGRTGHNGAFYAKYQAGVYGVAENLDVTVTDPNNEEVEKFGRAELKIRVPGLVPLDETGDLYTLRGSFVTPCDIQHNDSSTLRRSHYVTSDMILFIHALAHVFKSVEGVKLSFNDASLEFGGFFDDGVKDRSERCHVTHRHGVDIDVNVTSSDYTQCPNEQGIGTLNCPSNSDSELFVRHTQREVLDYIATQFPGVYKMREGTVHYRLQGAANQ